MLFHALALLTGRASPPPRPALSLWLPAHPATVPPVVVAMPAPVLPQQAELPSPTAHPNTNSNTSPSALVATTADAEQAPAPQPPPLSPPAPAASVQALTQTPTQTPTQASAASPTATAAPAEPSAQPSPLQWPTLAAQYHGTPQLTYPAESLKRREHGQVTVAALIGADGHVRQAQVHSSSGFERLDQAAVAAVMSWRYLPAMRDGQAQAVWMQVPVVFKLSVPQ